MRQEQVHLTEHEQRVALEALIAAASDFDYVLHAVSVESWHLHILVSHGATKVSTVAGQLKARMRQAINQSRGHGGKIWTAGYDKRFCFTDEQLEARHDYIRRHAGNHELPTP